MDPIQPIRLEPPTIPPVAPAPRSGRVERDSSRADDLDRRRRRRARRPVPQDPDAPGAGTDEPGPHIDVTA